MELSDALKDRNIDFVFNNDVTEFIAKKCDGKKTGARELRNIIRREIETQVVNMVISGNIPENKKLSASVKDNSIVLEFI